MDIFEGFFAGLSGKNEFNVKGHYNETKIIPWLGQGREGH